MRPTLTLMACELFGEAFEKALPAALSVEMFHNFSLVHDDIMDAAPLRRGKASIHEKWDLNTGILSGDAMLILSYRLFEDYAPGMFKSLTQLFSKTALEVCEGQQYDMDFGSRDDVSIPEYMKMIELKTSVLVSAALQMGAIVAQASQADQEAIFGFGRNLGLAFQLQDDYLDAFGDPESFGKQVGGDIIENKKTILYLKASELATNSVRKELEDLYSIRPKDPGPKIVRVTEIFTESGAKNAVQFEIESYVDQADMAIDKLAVTAEGKHALQSLLTSLVDRNT